MKDAGNFDPGIMARRVTVRIGNKLKEIVICLPSKLKDAALSMNVNKTKSIRAEKKLKS